MNNIYIHIHIPFTNQTTNILYLTVWPLGDIIWSKNIYTPVVTYFFYFIILFVSSPEKKEKTKVSVSHETHNICIISMHLCNVELIEVKCTARMNMNWNVYLQFLHGIKCELDKFRCFHQVDQLLNTRWRHETVERHTRRENVHGNL